MNRKNKLILEWLQDNIIDFIKYYPATKRVKLKNGSHISFRKLFKEVTGTPKATPKLTSKSTSKEVPDEVPKKKRKYVRKAKNTDK